MAQVEITSPVPTVTASSTLAGKDPQDAIGGGDFWESDGFMSAGVEWIKFDFGVSQALDRIDVSYPSSSKIATPIILEVSDNDSDWVEVATFSGLVQWTSQLDFTRAEGRYWRITEDSLQASHMAYWITEFYDTYEARLGRLSVNVVKAGDPADARLGRLSVNVLTKDDGGDARLGRLSVSVLAASDDYPTFLMVPSTSRPLV